MAETPFDSEIELAAAASDYRDGGLSAGPARDNHHFQQLQDLYFVFEHQALIPFFQPILQLETGEIYAYEGLIRGPKASELNSPVRLFEAANQAGLLAEIEHLCIRRVIRRFANLKLNRRLFLNVSPQTVLLVRDDVLRIASFIRNCGLRTDRVIIELTEHHQVADIEVFRQALVLFRTLGFRVAIDDLGEGFSSLKLWSDLRPDFVKIDMHFVQGISQDPVKFHFLKSLQQIAQNCGSALVAEGVEDLADFRLLHDLGIAFVQGYLVSPPAEAPKNLISPVLHEVLQSSIISVYPEAKVAANRGLRVERLMVKVTPVTPDTPNIEILHRFEQHADLWALPVVSNWQPLGLISRHHFIGQFVRAYRYELHGKKSCTMYMDPQPLIVEKNVMIQELSGILVESDQRYLSEGFILIDAGHYAGLGRGQDLIREMTRLQLESARYANPLTLLPGNVPINEHIERLLEAGASFVAAYCDLNHFKAYNDAYGYHLGDEMIKLCSRLLTGSCDLRNDFIGHIGGDDFIILFQSEDWEARCHSILKHFDREAKTLFSAEDLKRGLIRGEDRRGNELLFPLTSLAIGAVVVKGGEFSSHLQVAAAATETKKQAKREGKSSLWVERRNLTASAQKEIF